MDDIQVVGLELDGHDFQRHAIRIVSEEHQPIVVGFSVGWFEEHESTMLDDVPAAPHSETTTILSDRTSTADGTFIGESLRPPVTRHRDA